MWLKHTAINNSNNFIVPWHPVAGKVEILLMIIVYTFQNTLNNAQCMWSGVDNILNELGNYLFLDRYVNDNYNIVRTLFMQKHHSFSSKLNMT